VRRCEGGCGGLNNVETLLVIIGEVETLSNRKEMDV